MVEVKVENIDTPISAVVLGVETAGLWVHKGDVVENIAALGGGSRSTKLAEPALFLPFAVISWLVTETKEPIYQKAR